jgi:hypothetical protein
MTHPRTRAEMMAEVLRLQKLQSDDLAKGLFCTWTVEQEIAHQERSARVARLMRELSALDEITQQSA